MRDRPVPLPRQDRRVRLGADPGHGHHRQATKADQRRLRQLRHQVGLDLRNKRNSLLFCYS